MSAGAFTNSFYLSSELGTVHPIRVQPETISLTLGGQANTAPSGTGAIGPSAQVSGGKRSIGINARTVSIRLTAALSGYKADSVIRLPWLANSTFAALVPKVTTGTYLGTACILVGKSPETVK
jgi:hypothetical protein